MKSDLIGMACEYRIGPDCRFDGVGTIAQVSETPFPDYVGPSELIWIEVSGGELNGKFIANFAGNIRLKKVVDD